MIYIRLTTKTIDINFPHFILILVLKLKTGSFYTLNNGCERNLTWRHGSWVTHVNSLNQNDAFLSTIYSRSHKIKCTAN